MWKTKGELDIMEALKKLNENSSATKISELLPSFESLISSSFLDTPQAQQQKSIENAHEEIASLNKRIAELEATMKQTSKHKDVDVDKLANKIIALENEVAGIAQHKADLRYLHDMNEYNASDITEK